MDKYSSDRQKKNQQYAPKRLINNNDWQNNLDNEIKQNKPSHSSYKRKPIKKLFITCFSALFIGLIFGFIMLNIIQSDHSTDEQTSINSEQVTALSEHLEKKNEEKVTVPGLSAYTVQLGVFSTESNAEEYVEQLNISQNETMIWLRDSSYYVLSRIAQSSKEIEPMLKEIQKVIPDSFKKTWETDEFNITSTENLEQWLESFVKVWDHTLNDMSKIPKEQWEQLLDEQSSDESFSKIQQSIQQLLEVDSEDQSLQQQKLLNIWFQFEDLLFELDEK